MTMSTQSLLGQLISLDADYLIVDEAPKGPIGFVGTGFALNHPEYPIYAGIRINNAAVGTRAGYYTFGYYTGARLPIYPSFQFHPRLMFTAGGGAESNDGSGGFFTVASTIDYRYKSFEFGAGAQYSYVSTGVIQGASPFFSLSKHLSFEQPSISPNHIQVFTNTAVSLINEHNRTTGFIGVGGRSFQPNTPTYFSAYLTAAVTDLGGYMDVYAGYGTYSQFGPIRFLAEINAGTGGGGRAPAGGGLLYGVGGEIQYQQGEFVLGAGTNLIKSVNAPFFAVLHSVRLGTELKFNSTHFTNENFQITNLIVENSIRNYLGEDGFANLGVAFQLYRWKGLSVRGESYWAFTDGRGAYAEGLFGVRLTKGWLYAETQVGAGAGGGINLWNGAGLVFLNTGIDLPLSPQTSLNFKYIYNAYSTTPFPKNGVQLGFGYKIPFTKA